MSLAVGVIGSGSAGNCTVVRLGDGPGRRHLLIDAGLSPRRTARHLETCGAVLDDVGDILLTHLDRDHFFPGWCRVAVRQGIRIHVHDRHVRGALRAGIPTARLHRFGASFELEGGVRVEPVLLAHDQLGTVAYVLEHHGARLGYATDVGRVPDGLFGVFRGLHAVALESNYDRRLQVNASRPPFVKRRVMSGLGHLSNDQALEAILRIADRSTLAHVILLHISRQCNDPALVRRLYRTRAPALAACLTIAHQHRPTPMLDVVAGQLALF